MDVYVLLYRTTGGLRQGGVFATEALAHERIVRDALAGEGFLGAQVLRQAVIGAPAAEPSPPASFAQSLPWSADGTLVRDATGRALVRVSAEHPLISVDERIASAIAYVANDPRVVRDLLFEESALTPDGEAPLPWSSDDGGTVRDARGYALFTVDTSKPDADARFAADVVTAMNAAVEPESAPASSPLDRFAPLPWRREGVKVFDAVGGEPLFEVDGSGATSNSDDEQIADMVVWAMNGAAIAGGDPAPLPWSARRDVVRDAHGAILFRACMTDCTSAVDVQLAATIVATVNAAGAR